MSNEKKPKVMAVCINAWRKDASAHTLMNIFMCWDKEQLSMIYTRSELPWTENVCSRYFQISENKVLKSVFKPWLKTGMEVYDTPVMDESLVKEEHARYAKAHKKHSYLLTICRELVWYLGHWKSKELKEFIKDVDPDVIFVPIYPTVYMGWIQRYVKKLTNKPIVCYLADDNYSYDSCEGWLSYVHRYFLRREVKYLSTHCKEMFVIVEKEKEETDRLFGTDSVILTKGLDFSNNPYKAVPVNKPLKFVYTGSLIIGRSGSLALLADAINEANKEGVKATLDIYSGDDVVTEIAERLNRGACKHRGLISRDKVAEVQREADVVVFAEALEGKASNIARLSFSTKITDYLFNAKCILAIGKQEIAPIDYFERNQSALIATTKEEIQQRVNEIVANPELTAEYGKRAYDCAVKNHEKGMIDQRFIETMIRAFE